MPLSAGTTLGPYEILAPLGVGGMGEVYRARDTRLHRDVALKILPEVFAKDPVRLARFQREAQVLASLNHPNIGAIHGFEASQGVQALVLELVDGPTLADRIAEGPIPPDEALPIARQIATALETAHEQGIVHRDLKPANVKLRPDGTVKVLDFGLAKLTETGGVGATSPTSAGGSLQALTQSPTITTPAMTQMGMILGTAAYMSPEQAKGRPADKRSDIWAFGCVLFEMLTATRAFDGEDVSETLAAVLRAEPDWSVLPTDVPSHLAAFIQRCLVKDPRQRVSDVSVALYVLSESIGPSAVVRPSDDAHRRSARTGMAAGVGLMIGIMAAAGVGWVALRLRAPDPIRVARFSIAPPPTQPLNLQGQILAISPAGTHIVYQAGTGQGHLMVRAVDELEAHSLDSIGGRSPFFSPDGQWIGFFSNGGLRKVSTAGGPSIFICSFAGAGRGASWGPDGNIIFGTTSPATGLMSVSEGGGEPTVLTKPDSMHGELDHLFPSILPNGRAVLFTITRVVESEPPQVAILDLATRHTKPLIQAGTSAKYVDTGHVVYAVAGTLSAARFDPDRLVIVGDARPIVEHVRTSDRGADFSISRQGTLVYVPETPEPVRSLVWADRQGVEDPVKAPIRAYNLARVSPDGTRVALEVDAQGIWVLDLARETVTRLTSSPAGQGPVWTPDGRQIIFTMFRQTTANLYRQAADGTGTPERLATGDEPPIFSTSISRDGEYVFFTQAGRSGIQIGVLALSASSKSKARPLLEASSSGLTGAEISPDGRWLAYQSLESGRNEVYVRPFPKVDGGKWPISAGGGSRPAWARSGRELFYLDANEALTAVPVQATGETFSAGKPTKLFDTRYFGRAAGGRSYDVSDDGRRFLMIKEPSGTDERPTTPSIVVVENWKEELKRLVPSK